MPTKKTVKAATLDAFKGNPKAETNGVWFEDEETGMELLIAHRENPRYRSAIATEVRKYSRLINSNTERGNKKLIECDAKAKARTILIDWKNIFDADGNEIPYSVEMAEELLSDPAYREFQNLVEAFSGDDHVFGLVDREELGKA